MTPYSTGVMSKKRRGRAPNDEDDDLMGKEDRAAMAADSSDDENDIDADTMIKASGDIFVVATRLPYST